MDAVTTSLRIPQTLKMNLPITTRCTKIAVMAALWFYGGIFGFIATIWLLVSIFNFLERKAQNKALMLFQNAHPDLLSEFDVKAAEAAKVLADESCYMHTKRFPDYGRCYCCERGKLVLKRNRQDGSYFIGCTSYHAPIRHSRGRRYTLKSCQFTLSLF